MSKTLQPIKWYQNLDLNIILRTVNISGYNMRLYTNSYYPPGSYGIKQKVGKKISIKINNNLPGKYCPPMIMNCECGTGCRCRFGDNKECKCNNKNYCVCGIDCKCINGDSNECKCVDCKCKKPDNFNCVFGTNCGCSNGNFNDCKCQVNNTKSIQKSRTCCGTEYKNDIIHPSCCIEDTTMSMEDMPNPYEADPCTWRWHLHGFWGPGIEDNYRKAIKPGESYTFNYHIDKNHSTGLLVFHNHNYTTAESQVSATTVPAWIYNDCNEFPMINSTLKIPLFIQQLYMVPSTDPTVDQNTGSDYEIFNYWYWNQKPFSEFSKAVKLSKKFLIVNGDILPIIYLPINEVCLFDIGWLGTDDTWRLSILDDCDNPISYRIVKIDSLPVPNNKKFIVKDFLLAHMQRVTIIFSLPKYGQYRLVKNPINKESDSTFSAGKMNVMFINATTGPKNLIYNIENINVRPDYYIDTANRYFRNLKNVAAYRNYLFNFPNMGGTVMDMNPKQVQMVSGKSEVVIVGSADGGTHSYHIHLMNFCVLAWRNISLSETWNMYPKHQQIFQDTLLIESNMQYLVWLFPFYYGGKAMQHCHFLNHESNGMMLNVFISLNPNDKPSGVGLIEPTPEILKIVAESSY